MTSKGLKLSPFAFHSFPKIRATFFIHPLLKYDTLFYAAPFVRSADLD